MDLSVLEGDDPAGYRAEARIREAKRRAEEPYVHKRKRARNPGQSFGEELSARTSYRLNKQKDLDMLDYVARKREREGVMEELEKQREELNKTLTDKTAKRREKRHKKKQNKLEAGKGTTKDNDHDK